MRIYHQSAIPVDQQLPHRKLGRRNDACPWNAASPELPLPRGRQGGAVAEPRGHVSRGARSVISCAHSQESERKFRVQPCPSGVPVASVF